MLHAQALLAQAARGVAELREPTTWCAHDRRVGRPRHLSLSPGRETFSRAHPGVRVSIEPATSARAVERLRSHRAELGVVGGFVAAPEIEAAPLVEDEFVVMGPRQLGVAV